MRVRLPIILLIASLGYGCGYSQIQQLEDRALAARAEIEVQLQRRADLVPNLIRTAEAYLNLDQEAVDALSDARARLAVALRSGDLASMEASAADLAAAIQRVVALAQGENTLQSDPGFQMIESQLAGIETQIDNACRDYNEAVEEYNAFINEFPQAVTARVVGARPRPEFRPSRHQAIDD